MSFASVFTPCGQEPFAAALDYLDMPIMSLNFPILFLFWAPSYLLGHCHCSHSQQRAAVRDGGKAQICECVPETQAVPAMQQKEKGK